MITNHDLINSSSAAGLDNCQNMSINYRLRAAANRENNNNHDNHDDKKSKKFNKRKYTILINI